VVVFLIIYFQEREREEEEYVRWDLDRREPYKAWSAYGKLSYHSRYMHTYHRVVIF